jgi:hypothetical protein
MVDIAEAVCSDNKTAFGNVSLSRRTTICHFEEMNSDLLTQLNDPVQMLMYFSIALDDCMDTNDSSITDLYEV